MARFEYRELRVTFSEQSTDEVRPLIDLRPLTGKMFGQRRDVDESSASPSTDVRSSDPRWYSEVIDSALGEPVRIPSEPETKASFFDDAVFSHRSFVEYLNHLGQDGWQISSYTPTYFHDGRDLVVPAFGIWPLGTHVLVRQLD
jgi:hypothetical protein